MLTKTPNFVDSTKQNLSETRVHIRARNYNQGDSLSLSHDVVVAVDIRNCMECR